MLKLPDNLSIGTAVNPVARVLPVLATDNIGSAMQELNARAFSFVKGQEYLAQVMTKLDDKAYLVKVDQTMLKMELGTEARAGQTLLLRYMQDSPIPTFLLAPPTAKSSGAATELSPAAQLIGRYLKEAESAGASTRHEATSVVTHSPKNPQLMAQDLRQALSNSGLFYESHLNAMMQGQRTVAALMQEPQNHHNAQIATLMAQQLAVLDNQRLSWHGEVWPGQKMDWDVHLQERPNAEEFEQQDLDESRLFASEITLHLPNLGKVTAKLSLVGEHVRINILAEQTATLDTLKNKSDHLTQAMTDSGLQLDALTVTSYE